MGKLLEKYTGHFSPTTLDSLKGKTSNYMIEEEVYTFMRNAILSGVFPPGYHFSEAEMEDLEDRLGATKAMVREALVRLTSDNLVQYKPEEGFTVSVLKLEDLREIYFLRSILEGAAARLACENLSAEDIQKLEGLCRQMKYSLENKEVAQLSLLNTDFHETIYSSANSPRLYKMIVQLWNGFFHSSISFLAKRAPQSVSEHHAIFEALKNRDCEKAERMIREHTMSSLKDLEEYWSKRL
ncbi:MAG TPA: GntR family transcriptional regulator [Peptococcaceae bacterium]|nr:GntR family transcriptional regulator [Peptococcaceae bacterium]